MSALARSWGGGGIELSLGAGGSAKNTGCSVDRGLYTLLYDEIMTEVTENNPQWSGRERSLETKRIFRTRHYVPDMDSVIRENSGLTEYEGPEFEVRNGEIYYPVARRTLNELFERVKKFRPDLYSAEEHQTAMLAQEKIVNASSPIAVTHVSYFRDSQKKEKIRDTVTLAWDGEKGSTKISNIAPDGKFESVEQTKRKLQSIFFDAVLEQQSVGVYVYIRSNEELVQIQKIVQKPKPKKTAPRSESTEVGQITGKTEIPDMDYVVTESVEFYKPVTKAIINDDRLLIQDADSYKPAQNNPENVKVSQSEKIQKKIQEVQAAPAIIPKIGERIIQIQPRSIQSVWEKIETETQTQIINPDQPEIQIIPTLIVTEANITNITKQIYFGIQTAIYAEETALSLFVIKRLTELRILAEFLPESPDSDNAQQLLQAADSREPLNQTEAQTKDDDREQFIQIIFILISMVSENRPLVIAGQKGEKIPDQVQNDNTPTQSKPGVLKTELTVPSQNAELADNHDLIFALIFLGRLLDDLSKPKPNEIAETRLDIGQSEINPGIIQKEQLEGFIAAIQDLGIRYSGNIEPDHVVASDKISPEQMLVGFWLAALLYRVICSAAAEKQITPKERFMTVSSEQMQIIKERPWILAAIIYYLAMLKEQAQPQAGQKVKKNSSKTISRGKSDSRQRGIIFKYQNPRVYI
ncbi:hypothetical protein A2154_00525 [Candidatus Gottesmanbacteria bacterium RBG_16_43_7]|uniref:Uncharacterized protein n=1 Tax=Candidatus Gottesmanbacteria bacterium RBG_16_43_7 TaxID=1798373 RepID=A0A1F5Z8Z5_9BACT|nr:MAG: hypothetical protein A2154_00525 [Candidatus Gottesmanbacteria bacterium RBG_16_43_7]